MLRAISRSEELAGGLSFIGPLHATDAVHADVELVGEEVEAAGLRRRRSGQEADRNALLARAREGLGAGDDRLQGVREAVPYLAQHLQRRRAVALDECRQYPQQPQPRV